MSTGLAPQIEDTRRGATPKAADHPLRELCDAWCKVIKIGEEQKEKRFGKYANEAMMFFDGPHTWMWDQMKGGGDEGLLGVDDLPAFRIQVNKVSEIVDLFTPSLVARNPHITVQPEQAPDIAPEALGMNTMDPMAAFAFQNVMMQQQAMENVHRTHAGLYERYLNWLQVTGQKKKHARHAIIEALIKGESCLWTEMHQPPGSDVWYPQTFYDTVDNWVKDPDAPKYEDMNWMARKCSGPIHQVAEEYEIPIQDLRGHYESRASQANRKQGGEGRKDVKERSLDHMTYWKVYSKIGIGDRLIGVPDMLRTPEAQEQWRMIGDYAFMVVAENVPYPLNLHTNKLEIPDEEKMTALQWPIPFWLNGSWPVERIAWKWKPNDVWCISPVKPGIGYLKFINWCFSFLADKVAACSGTMVGVMKSAVEDLRDQLRNQRGPYKIVEIAELTGKRIEEVISFLDAPTFHIDMWNMLQAAMAQFDKATGLAEILYGGAPIAHDRSAKETEVREERATVRLDDMAVQAEDALSNVAEKEMIAARWFCEQQDVIGCLGPVGAQVWQQQILTQEVDSVVRDYVYSVAAGSTRKPNKRATIDALEQLGQMAMPTIQAFAMQGLVGPWNAFMTDYGKAIDALNAEAYKLPNPMMGPPQGPPPTGPPQGPPPNQPPGGPAAAPPPGPVPAA